ncbi:hypothetical protein [Solimonas flava]|uniref:hypothetical protein n=1 Tax=Solimonas flava TaxID=415849 RepID=UPI000487E655|nr:hypothetical protein [Solimonas flava]
MSHALTASPQTAPAESKPARRRGGRSKPMAVDTRSYARVRRRESAAATAAKARADWRDLLIPSGVVASLGFIAVYHHAVLLETVTALF